MKFASVIPDKCADPRDDVLLTPPSSVIPFSISSRPLVPWLRKTEYISNEPSSKVEKTIEKKVIVSEEVKKPSKTSFELVLETCEKLVHPTNKNLTVKHCLPIYPDFENWSDEFTLGVFESNPIGTDNKVFINNF